MSVRKSLKESEPAQVRRCMNHFERGATHQLLNSSGASDNFYCDKCSIKLASQGFTVLKLALTPKTNTQSLIRNDRPKRLDSKALRKNNIDRFLGHLLQTKSKLDTKNLKLQQYLIKSELQFGQIFQAVNQFFTQIQEIIQFQKHTAYHNVLNKRTKNEAEARFLKSNIQEQIEDIEMIMEDIRTNMDSVENVENSIYTEIMNGYSAKISIIEDFKVQAHKLPSIEKFNLHFPEIPQALQTLSNRILIHSHKSSTFASNMNSIMVYKVVTEEEENQSSSFFSQKSQKPLKMTKISKDKTQPINSFASFNNTQEIGFSFEESSVEKGDTPYREEDSENQMIRSNLISARNMLSEGRSFMKEVGESKESIERYLRDRSVISQADTLLIA